MQRLRSHELHLYEIERGHTFALSRAPLAACVDQVHRVPPAGPNPALRALDPAMVVARSRLTERAIATAIDAAAFDVALVHPSMHLQAPSLLTHLRTPSVYCAQEPRRLSHDAPYIAARRAGRRRSLRSVGAGALEWSLRRGDQRATQAATNIVCNSDFTAESLFRAYGRSARVCRPGVDTRLFAPAETPRSGRHYVVAVGALDPVKNLDMVIEAVALIPADRRPALHAVYERSLPGEEDRLVAMAHREGVSLHLRRGLDDAALVAAYRGAVATVCASRLEPFGLTALESLSTGTPVVAIREGGFRETVRERVGGVLVEPTPRDLASGIVRVLDGDTELDPLRIRATVMDQGWEHTTACLEATLAETAGRGRR
jgi:glycosyltransferase involved in cell wall biosynthesis